MSEPTDHSSTAKAGTEAAAVDCVCAIAHEIANHLGAIRLQAELLDETLDARALARATHQLDALAGQASPLLSLVRPLLGSGGEPEREDEVCDWAALVADVGRQLEDEGTRGVAVEVGVEATARGAAGPRVPGLASIVLAWMLASLELRPVPSRIAVFVSDDGGLLSLTISDDGPAEAIEDGAALRGRGLVAAIARTLLARVGGEALATSEQGGSRLVLRAPRVA